MSTLLSGSFDTSELPRLASEPVTVTVGRQVLPGKEAEFEAWAEQLMARVERFPGSLGAGLLKPGQPGGEYQIVFRFNDALSLRAWERSPQRTLMLGEVDSIVTQTRVMRTVGVENWFDLPDRAEPKQHAVKAVITDVAWAFPVVAAASIYLGPKLLRLPFELRTAASMLVVTTVMRLAVGPMRGRLRKRRRLG